MCVCGNVGVDISNLGCSNFRSMALGGKGESLWGVEWQDPVTTMWTTGLFLSPSNVYILRILSVLVTLVWNACPILVDQFHLHRAILAWWQHKIKWRLIPTLQANLNLKSLPDQKLCIRFLGKCLTVNGGFGTLPIYFVPFSSFPSYIIWFQLIFPRQLQTQSGKRCP